MNTSKLTILSTEEFSNETALFMSDGSEVKFETSKLIDFIEYAKLNMEYTGTGLVCDPNGTEEEIEIDSTKYLDDNFNEVCNAYYSSLTK